MVVIIIIRVIPALGAAKIGDIVASQSHTLATLTALVSRCVVDGKVLQVLAGKCSLGNQNRKSMVCHHDKCFVLNLLRERFCQGRLPGCSFHSSLLRKWHLNSSFRLSCLQVFKLPIAVVILLSVLLGRLLVNKLERTLAAVQPCFGLGVLVFLKMLHELHGRVGAVSFLSIEAGRLKTERALQLVRPVVGHLEVLHNISVPRRPE